MSFASRVVRWTMLGTMLAVFAGCGDSLVGTTGGTPGGGTTNPALTGPDILVVYPDGTTAWTKPPLDYDPQMASGPGHAGTRNTVTMPVVGLLGAKLQCGRFFLTIPPGAFLGTGTVTMSTLDSTLMICDVEIFPKTLNLFREPVQLSMSTVGANCDSDSLTMYWYDPDAKDWVDMGVDRDLSDNPECTGGPYPANMTGIVATLQHFSRYGGGKAGW